MGFHTAAFSPGPEVYLRVLLTDLFLQVSGQTNRPLTLQTPMPWWQLLPLEKDYLIGDLQAAVDLASQASQELEQSLQEPQGYSRCRLQVLQASSSQCSVGCKWLKQGNQVRWQGLSWWQTLNREVGISRIVCASSIPSAGDFLLFSWTVTQKTIYRRKLFILRL